MGMLLPRNKARFESEAKEIVKNSELTATETESNVSVEDVTNESTSVPDSANTNLDTAETLESEILSMSSQEENSNPEVLDNDFETVAIEVPKDDLPTLSSKKDDIKAWLDAQGITYTNDLTKAQLLALVPVTE
ncbi:hypothetical protein RyT2_14970 [Pseudolactococcus yaeyamensis]